MFNWKIKATNDKWITVHPNGKENKGRALLIKDGESVEDAMHRNGWYAKRQVQDEKYGLTRENPLSVSKEDLTENEQKYYKKNKDIKVDYSLSLKKYIINPYFSEKSAEKNREKIKQKQKIEKLAEEFIKKHPDYNPHEEFIKKQISYQPWKYNQITAANAIYLKDSNGQEGRPFEARFLQPGLVKYDFGVCLLKKETIDKFIDTFIGKPVIIDHKDDIALEDRKGGIEKIWFNPEDGWYWCSGILTDKQAVELVEKGYNVSCQYAITDFSINTEGKLHNGNPYDKEILDGNFEHLAIVENPRYEDAFIAVNAYIAKIKDKYKPVFDYIRTTKGEPMDKETKGVFDQLLAALKARNEAEDETKDEKDDEAKNKAKNEDKRKIIDEVGGILKGKVDDEIIRTVIGKLEKLAYEPSEDSKADNTAKNEDDEENKEDKKDDKTAENKSKNEDGEDNTDYKKLYEELKEKTEEEAENKKAKNALDKAVNEIYDAVMPKGDDLYISPQKGLELGKKIYG